MNRSWNMNRSWKFGALFWCGKFALWLSPNFSKLQSLGIENGRKYFTPMVAENSLRSYKQSSLDQQMGEFVWYSLFASQTSLFVRSGGFFAWVSCWNCHRHPSSGHALHILPTLWTLIKASGRRSQQHTKYMSVQLFSHAELCLAC